MPLEASRGVAVSQQYNNYYFLVGYDITRMVLDGKFEYMKENQRTLSFNVKIDKLPKSKTVFVGASSKVL